MNDPFGNFGAPDLDPFDLETVEILRGPQGTTFGASALNGELAKKYKLSGDDKADFAKGVIVRAKKATKK